MIVSAPAEVVDVEMHGIAAGGDGVGRVGGLVVFVPRTAVNDLARVRLQSVKRFARGQLESLIRPSPDRVEPPCPHYTADRCGGCQLQHIRYDAQLAAKRGVVRDSIQRIAKRAVEVPATRPSPSEWRYRNKLTLTMRRSGPGWMMGLHPFDDPDGIFQLVDCPITDERVVAAWREVMAAAAHLPETPALRGTVRLAGDDIVLLVRGGTEWIAWEKFFAGVPSASALWWAPAETRPRQIAERRLVAAATAFGQVNREVGEALHLYVVKTINAYAPATVIDAYAGTGETAAALAASGTRVTAIEVDREAAELCAARLPRGSRSVVGRVERVMMDSLPADVVLLNPPRVGLDERVAIALERHREKVKAVIYVSCDPGTLARDLSRLPGYRITSIETFDMFPQTAHVETICELVPLT